MQCSRVSGQAGVLAKLALGVSKRYILSRRMKREFMYVSVLPNLTVLSTALRCMVMLFKFQQQKPCHYLSLLGFRLKEKKKSFQPGKKFETASEKKNISKKIVLEGLLRVLQVESRSPVNVNFLTPVKTLYSAFWSSCWTSSVCLFLLKHQPVLYMPCISSLKLAVTFLSSSLIVLTCFPVPAPFYHCKFPLLHILPSRSLIVKASNMFPGVQPCGTSLVT